jgi:hypothetical protein
MICQSYWKVWHWYSEYECGICMVVLRHILAVLCEMFAITLNMNNGYIEEDLLHGLHAHQI